MKYADYNSAIADRANITGYYDSDIHSPRTVLINGKKEPNPSTKIPLSAVEITEEEWLASIGSPGMFWINPSTLVFELAPALPDIEQLTTAKAARVAELRVAAETEIRGAFAASVVGTLHYYSLSEKALLDLMQLSIASKRHEGDNTWKRRLHCIPDGQTKARPVLHSAQQLQELHDAIIDWQDARQDHLETLLNQVEAVEITVDLATALAEIAAITWE